MNIMGCPAVFAVALCCASPAFAQAMLKPDLAGLGFLEGNG